MPEQYRALIVLLALATAVFAIARAPACAVAMGPADFTRRRNLWLGITLTVFLANNFWVYIVVATVLLLAGLQKESNRLAMYFFLLFAVPPIPNDITGLGVVNYFFSIDYLRLLSLAVLLPAWFTLRSGPDAVRFGRLLPDKFLIGFLILQFGLMFAVSTVTNTLRIGVFYSFIDIFLPYYVASRALKDLQGFRDALMAFVLASLVLSTIAVLELSWRWLLYRSLDSELGVIWAYGNYLPRGTTVRATGPTGHSIALGYVIAVGMGFFLYLRKSIPNQAIWHLGMLAMCGGLIAALSRGPWVGAVAMLLIYIAAGPTPGKSLGQLTILGVIAVPLLLVFPFGQEIIDHLPFVGTVDAQSVSYRQRLFEISIRVIMDHPMLGAYDFFYSPAMQELRQGNEGFIDLVNTYAGVGLSSGLVGLSLFSGFFIAIAVGIYKGMRRVSDRNSELRLLGRALLAVLVCIMIIIFTVSSITVIPVVYWAVAGLGVAYARMVALEKVPVKKAPETARLSRLHTGTVRVADFLNTR